jgi:hypothetical protein
MSVSAGTAQKAFMSPIVAMPAPGCNFASRSFLGRVARGDSILVRKVPSNFRRNLAIRHLVNCFNTYDAFENIDLPLWIMYFLEAHRFWIAKQLVISKWCQANNALE